MKIEAGRYYKTRDGKTVGPMRRGVPGDGEKYWISDDSLGLYVSAWFEDGSFWPAGHACKNANNAKLDLILPAYPEQGTLKEIGAKPGDVVEWMGTRGRDRDFVSYKIVSNNLGGWMAESEYGNKQLISDDPWRIISRASDTPACPVRTVTTTRISSHGTWSPRGKMPKTQYVYEVEFDLDGNGHPDWSTATVKGK